jgi:hypothetical protein
MKTAALDSPYTPDLLASLGLQTGTSVAEPSTEDRSHLFPPTALPAPRRPLLRRALAAVLRR